MDPQQLLTEIDSELRTVLGAFLTTTAPASDVTATDDSGRVSVTVHPDGTLARVLVAADWQEEIEAPHLASTIVQVAVSAQGAIPGVEDAGEADPAAVEMAREALLDEAADELLAPLSEYAMQKQIDALPALLAQLDAQLDDAIAQTSKQDDDDLPRPDPGEEDEDLLGDIVDSENNMVRVQLFRGHLADVRIKESWLDGRSGIAVSQCFDEIIERADENYTNEQG